MVGTGDARRRGCKQRRPLARRAPLVVGQRVIVQKRIGVWRIWIRRGLKDQNLPCHLLSGRRLEGKCRKVIAESMLILACDCGPVRRPSLSAAPPAFEPRRWSSE